MSTMWQIKVQIQCIDIYRYIYISICVHNIVYLYIYVCVYVNNNNIIYLWKCVLSIIYITMIYSSNYIFDNIIAITSHSSCDFACACLYFLY